MLLTFKGHIFNVYLLHSQYPCIVAHTKSFICPGSEKYLLESFTAFSRQFTSSLSVWLSGVSASLMHRPFFFFFSSVQAHILESRNILLDITAHALSTPALARLVTLYLVWLFFLQSKLRWTPEHFTLLILISTSLIQLVSTVVFSSVEMNIFSAVFFIMEQSWMIANDYIFNAHGAAVNAKQAFLCSLSRCYIFIG